MNELAKFTTEQLKVMVYDLSGQLEFIKQQITIANDEILKRAKEEQAKKQAEVAE